MEDFRAEGELPGDAGLKVRPTAQRASGGKKQRVMFTEINDRTDVRVDAVAATIDIPAAEALLQPKGSNECT